jgi:hypothetical protein
MLVCSMTPARVQLGTLPFAIFLMKYFQDFIISVARGPFSFPDPSPVLCPPVTN